MDIASPKEHDDESEYFASWVVRKQLYPETVNWIPPVRIFRYTAIFEEAWGWDRLLPHTSVPIPTYGVSQAQSHGLRCCCRWQLKT